MRLKTEWQIIQMLKYLHGGLKRHPLLPEPPPPDRSLAAVERAHIQRVLEESRNLTEAAETLGICRRTLYEKRQKYGLQ